MSHLRRVARSRWLTGTLFVLLVLNLGLQAWGLELFGTHIDYTRAGTWGNMVSGVASAVAVTVAVRSFAAQDDRYRADKADEKEKEMTSVYAWIESRRALGDGDPKKHWYVGLDNQTRAPIYEWAVHVAASSESPERCISCTNAGTIRPGVSTLFVKDAESANYSLARVSVRFKSFDGRFWLRDEGGLKPVGEIFPA